MAESEALFAEAGLVKHSGSLIEAEPVCKLYKKRDTLDVNRENKPVLPVVCKVKSKKCNNCVSLDHLATKNYNTNTARDQLNIQKFL